MDVFYYVDKNQDMDNCWHVIIRTRMAEATGFRASRLTLYKWGYYPSLLAESGVGHHVPVRIGKLPRRRVREVIIENMIC
jgi:hypothetical protein